MSALDDLRNKNFSEKDHIEKAITELWEDTNGYEWLAEKASEELAALRDVKGKAAIVIAGWELMSKTSEYDLDMLKESLRKYAALKGEA